MPNVKTMLLSILTKYSFPDRTQSLVSKTPQAEY